MARPPDIDVDRLCRAVTRSQLALRRYQGERREMVRQYLGAHWSEEGSRKRVPVNLIGLYVKTVSSSLVPKTPRALLSTFRRQHKATVSAMQTWVNRAVQKMRLADTLQRVVVDALFSVGILKVALAGPADAAGAGWNLRAGEPYAERVDLDDFVFDPAARDFNSVSFIGHRYRVPLRAIRDSKLYSRHRKNLTPSSDPPYGRTGEERVKQLGQQYVAGQADEFEDMADLWQVYLPRHRLVLTLEDADGEPAACADGNPLRTQSWLGPDAGPYHVLAFGVVPDNAMPKAPLMDLVDLHEAANDSMRKFFRQAADIKDVLLVSNTEDGQKIVDAMDGEAIRVQNPQAVQQITLRVQAIQQVMGAAMAFIERFDWLAGNLSTLGGLSSEAKTAHQEELLNQNSSRAVQDMQERTVALATDVFTALCWFWHHDPRGVMHAAYDTPGLPEYPVELQVTPDDRQRVPFEALEVKVDPYSLQHNTPQSRVQFLMQIVTQVIAPMMPVLQQQGISFDLNKWLQKISELGDQPDLADILTIQEPRAQDGGNAAAGSARPPMPAQTKREYVRHSVSERTGRGTAKDMIARFMGHDPGGRNGTMKPAGV